jgi:cell division protein FtsN
MAKARRSPFRSRSRPRSGKKSHGILWLIAGLLFGAALMWGAQHYYYRDSKPFAGLASLFSSGKKSIDASDRQKPPETERLPKPKLDFYTILPEFETVLPEPKSGKKTTKTEPPEAGVNYILQAGSFGNLEDADRLKAKLTLSGLETHIEKVAIEGKGAYYRVRLGPYSSVEALDSASAKLAQLGIKALRIKVKKSAG